MEIFLLLDLVVLPVHTLAPKSHSPLRLSGKPQVKHSQQIKPRMILFMAVEFSVMVAVRESTCRWEFGVWFSSRFTASVVCPSLVLKRVTFASGMNHRFITSDTYLGLCNCYLFNARIEIDWELLTECIVICETTLFGTVWSPTWD